MKRLGRLVPSPSMAVATLALLVASAGVGVAATRLPANSVGTAQLQKGSVSSVKVRDGSLLAADFKAGQIVGRPGPAGAAGPKGDPGPKGDAGAKGDTGPRGPSWGDAAGPGYGTNPSLYTMSDYAVDLPVPASPKLKAKFFLFGRLSYDLTCGPNAPCNQNCFVSAGGSVVQGTSVNVSGKAGERVQGDVAVFGTTSLAGTLGVTANSKPPKAQWACRFTASKTSSTGYYVGVIQLGS